jgi:hydrogenase maturation protease
MRSIIICIGNRYVDMDAAGMQVYSLLQAMAPLPQGVEVIEGGLAGLNLLPLLEQGGRVVFVDAVQNLAQEGELTLLDGHDLGALARADHYGHDGGLAYLLGALPHVCEGTLPTEMVLIGLEGKCSTSVLEQAALLSLEVAMHGIRAS